MNSPAIIKTAGLKIHARIDGSGPPLLFLGGSNFDLSLKPPVFDSALPQHFTVAAADPRGLGQTEHPPGEWSMQDYARDALLLLDALEWDCVDVLGESFGAMVALHLAAQSPKRINRMALAAGAPGGAGGSSYPIEELLLLSDPTERAQRSLEVMDSRFTAFLRDEPEHAQQRIRDRVITNDAFIASHNNATGYPRLLQARAAHDCWDSLPQIDITTFVFAGRFDQQAPIDRAQNMVRALPNSTLVSVDDGHAHCFASSKPVDTIISHWRNN